MRVNQIGKMTLIPDTIKDYFNDDEAYFESEIRFKDEGGNLWKIETFLGGDHGSESEIRFYEPTE